MATITVFREYGIPLGRRMRVLVDGARVGGIKSERSLSVPVPSGEHTVQVTLDWQSSAPVRLTLAASDEVTLRARVDLRATSWRSIFRGRHEALDLDVVGHPRRASDA